MSQPVAAVACGKQSAQRHQRTGARRFQWPRFVLLASAGFLWSLFLAPAAQFLNEFLRTERGFSGALIAVFVLATNTPAGIGSREPHRHAEALADLRTFSGRFHG